MKEQILQAVLKAIADLKLELTEQQKSKITVTNPSSTLGDFATNAALILSKVAGKKPLDLAKEIIEKLDSKQFEQVDVAGAGFINFRIKDSELIKSLKPTTNSRKLSSDGKILLEYFQPNIAKPLHIGHLRTAIIGDSIKRLMQYAGLHVESDTHMGDWGTQFGFLIMACQNLDKIGHNRISESDLNDEYVRLNAQAETNPSVHEQAKLEFAKLEQGDKANRAAWDQIVSQSIQKFLKFAETFELLPFDHHWPESFYEDKMPAVVEKLKAKGLLVESQGAQIVNLEDQKLGIAVVIKSDGATTYLLRDLATFWFVKTHGFTKHLYVVDTRQSHHYQQLFTILKLLGELDDGEAEHIEYGFISFKGAALSTRKGNMVLAEEVLTEASKRVAKIIQEKNPDLKNREHAIQAVSIGAIKYYDLSHNRHSDFEFDWDDALNFEGNSGPYLQYAYARLSGILTNVNLQGGHDLTNVKISDTERELIIKSSALPDVVAEALKDYLPNLLANYLFELAGLVNKFYHESPVMKETDEKLKFFRLQLVSQASAVLKQGLYLLGIEALDEM